MAVSMPGGNFNEELHVKPNGTVDAAGPFDTSVAEVTEMCVWVLQREGTDDAIANAMGMPDMPGMPSDLKVFDLGKSTARWTFPLKERFKVIDFHDGSATAMATGVFRDKHGTQRGFFWSEPVRLVVRGGAASR
jgi:hypothetical protein